MGIGMRPQIESVYATDVGRLRGGRQGRPAARGTFWVTPRPGLRPGNPNLMMPLANCSSEQRFDGNTLSTAPFLSYDLGQRRGSGSRRTDDEVLTMSLQSPLGYPIPEQTSLVAHAAFPKGNPYMRMRDTLGPIFTNPEFAALFPKLGQPAEAPAHLALSTILQFAEGLSDAQAADAVRGRIDWKYALGLSLIDPGFDHTVLSEFRSRLVEGKAEQLLLDTTHNLRGDLLDPLKTTNVQNQRCMTTWTMQKNR
jgi:transposase